MHSITPATPLGINFTPRRRRHHHCGGPFGEICALCSQDSVVWHGTTNPVIPGDDDKQLVDSTNRRPNGTNRCIIIVIDRAEQVY